MEWRALLPELSPYGVHPAPLTGMGSGFAKLLSVLLALVAIFTGGGTWFQGLESRVETLSVDVNRLKAELATLSAHADEAQNIQARLDLSLKEPKLLSQEIASTDWTLA